LAATLEPPEQNVRIEQNVHSIPHLDISALVIGLKNARGTRIFPASLPGMRFFLAVATGTSLATGCLPRAMTTSFPRHASLMRRERFVFA